MYCSFSKTNTLSRILGLEEWPNWNISFKNYILGFDQPSKILVQDEMHMSEVQGHKIHLPQMQAVANKFHLLVCLFVFFSSLLPGTYCYLIVKVDEITNMVLLICHSAVLWVIAGTQALSGIGKAQLSVFWWILERNPPYYIFSVAWFHIAETLAPQLLGLSFILAIRNPQIQLKKGCIFLFVYL